MNLRILKKLSKRAAPLVVALGDSRERFKSEKWEGENPYSRQAFERKHWRRCQARYPIDGDPKYMPRHGKQWIVFREPSSPLKGTEMFGSMDGYYEPEWGDKPAWAVLTEYVLSETTDWNTEELRATRHFSNPSEILAFARQMVLSGEPK